MASHRERRQRKLINKFLTFRKIAVYYLVSRKMVHSAMVASFRQSDCNENADRRRPPDCDPGRRAPIAHPPYDLDPYDVISSETAEIERMALTPKQGSVGCFRGQRPRRHREPRSGVAIPWT